MLYAVIAVVAFGGGVYLSDKVKNLIDKVRVSVKAKL